MRGVVSLLEQVELRLMQKICATFPFKSTMPGMFYMVIYLILFFVTTLSNHLLLLLMRYIYF